MEYLSCLGEREILWIWDDIGNVGKSELTEFLCSVYNCFLLDPTISSKDTWYSYSQRGIRGKHMAVMDIPRDAVNDLNYNILEQCKSKFLQIPKYQSQEMIKPRMKVIVFAN